MDRYLYDGPVMEFGRCIASRYRAVTSAISPQKALCNIAFRFKKENGKEPFCKVLLDEEKLQKVN